MDTGVMWEVPQMARPLTSPDQPTWRARANDLGWVLLPLRGFLGVTMVYAGLLKFFDANYLDSASPNGVQSQMTAAAATSPIGGLVAFTAEHASLFGLTIAFGELIVGLGVLLGLWTRIAAIGGFLLSLSFFLTVSWGTTPYFFGSDIVFMFAFTPLIIGGDGGLFSLTSAIRDATRRRMRLAVPPPQHESSAIAAEVSRRALIRTGITAAIVGAGAIVVGAVGRFSAGGSSDATTAGQSSTAPSSTAGPSGSSAAPANGVQIAQVADIPVGGVVAFNDPNTGEPAFLLQPAEGTYLAYSGVCTHQGCTVGFDQGSNTFVCPCHGAEFDGSNGDVVRGPATQPLAKIPVTESGGIVYAV